MKKELSDFIKNKMKENGFKSKLENYYKTVGDNFLIVWFLGNKEKLITTIEYKKYSHDRIYWNIVGRDDLLSKKSDSDRIFAVDTIKIKDLSKVFEDLDCDEDVILKRIENISNEVSDEIMGLDINSIILNGDYSSKVRCIALIDSNREDEAIDIAIDEINAGHSGGHIKYGKSFFQMLIDKYANPSDERLKSINPAPINDMPGIIPEPSTKSAAASSSSSSAFPDKAKWQYDSALEYFCESNTISKDEISSKDTKMIWNLSSNHITMFVTWLAMNDLLSEMHYEDEKEVKFISSLKERNESGFTFFEKYFDLVLSTEDIASDVFSVIDAYYEKNYLKDYSSVCEPLTTPFSWEDYDKIERIISKSTGIGMKDEESSVTISQTETPKKKWYQFWKK